MAGTPDEALEPPTETPRTIECDIDGCPDPVIAVPGKMAPKAMLGLHKRNVHGIASTNKRAKRERDGRSATVSPLHAVSSAIAETGGKGAPNKTELTKTAARVYGYAMTGIWSMIVDSDPELHTNEQRDAAIEMVQPTNAQCLATVKPLARAFSTTKLNAKYGRGFVDNADVLDCVVAIAEQIRAGRTYLRTRATGAEHPPGAGAPNVDPGATGAPGPAHGILVTREMVEQMRREQGSSDASD